MLLAACSSVPPANREAAPAGRDMTEQGTTQSTAEGAGPAAEGNFGAVLRSRADLRPLVFPDIPAIQPLWRPLYSTGAGLSVFAGRTQKPRLEFWAVRVTLDPPEKSPRPRILLGAGDKIGDNGEDGGDSKDGGLRFGFVSSTRVSSFVRDNGLLAGINTVPFDPSSAREGEERRVDGLGIAGGRLIALPIPRYDALVFYRDGGAAIVNQGEFAESGNFAGGKADSFADGFADRMGREVLHATGGFHRILRDGELTIRALRPRGPRYARSAVGLSAGGQTLYLLVINGGRIGRRGATEAETALILKQLGAQDALNLDGGGSSALALRFPGGAADGAAGECVAVLNTPVHSGFPGRERAVALCLGIGWY
ncbi:MAG: phosphodiester glycosidase family protein [Treponema sp.]|nr:phosphodiester glycosidase family protein [Treponema sp.]